MQEGQDMDTAMKKLAPPVFFKQAPMFKAQAQNWSLPVLDTILEKLNGLEAQCKQTGMPVEILCSQAILAISKSRAA
jgi:DNA polymerase-3 subunit delta